MSAQIIPFNQQATKQPVCSFCNATESSAQKLVEGMNGHFICDKCIAKATELLSKESAA